MLNCAPAGRSPASSTHGRPVNLRNLENIIILIALRLNSGPAYGRAKRKNRWGSPGTGVIVTGLAPAMGVQIVLTDRSWSVCSNRKVESPQANVSWPGLKEVTKRL